VNEGETLRECPNQETDSAREEGGSKHTMSLLEFARWLNNTGISVYLRESDWPFPIIESVHILALGFSVGTIMWVDLRLMGWTMRKEPVADVVRQLEPWAIPGFIAMFISGFLLLLAEPLKCYTNFTFQFKALFIILAALNVMYFHKKLARNMDTWDHDGQPWRAKMVGAISLCLWLAIVILGRWFAYFGTEFSTPTSIF
jgi:hypothetical protein